MSCNADLVVPPYTHPGTDAGVCATRTWERAVRSSRRSPSRLCSKLYGLSSRYAISSTHASGPVRYPGTADSATRMYYSSVRYERWVWCYEPVPRSGSRWY
eukprot:934093-Rhodomonas_salina.1